MYRVPGLHCQLPFDDFQAAEGQGEGNQEQVQTSLAGENVTDTPVGSDYRCVDFNTPRSTASTPTLSRSPSTMNPRTSPPPLIRVEGDIGGAEYEGFELVDQQLGNHQWETNSRGITTDDDRIRCLQYRLGSVLEQPDDRRPLVVPGISTPHQRQGVVGCVSSTSNLCGKKERNTCSPEIGQHDCRLLHKSDGRYPFQEADGIDIPDLGLEPGEENYPHSQASPRRPERRRGSGVKEGTGQLGVETRSSNFSSNYADSGSLSGGPVCLQNISSASEVHELEARSRSHSNRCTEPALEGYQRLCFSPVCIDRQVPVQDSEGASQRVDTHCSSVANPTVVGSYPVNVVSETNPSTKSTIPSVEQQQQKPSTNTSVESSRVANIRNSLNHQGVSNQATTLILSSWRKTTEDAYSCCWRRWEQWCTSAGYNSIHAPISAILDFLARQFAEGKQYRTINSYRSAISMTHTPIDGVVVGKHPLVTRLMKGVFNRRPPQPRYSFTWDVGMVLEHVCSLGKNNDISLKQLSHKLVVLLALSNASRASEIHALDIRYLKRDTG